MKKPQTPLNEMQRLQDLLNYKVLDTPAEKCFDDLAIIAAHICQTPIAAISLIDKDRQWFKAKVGIEATETSRDLSFCGHTINQKELLEVQDATKDERFADNPFVTGDLGVRFYAGAQIVTPNGNAIGSLCVIDQKPRALTPDQMAALEALSRQVTFVLELHKSMREAEQQNDQLKKFAGHIAKQEAQLVQAAKMSSLGEMAAGVAHEINNPLAIIVGKADRLSYLSTKENTNLSSVAPDLEKIKNTANRIAKIVKGLKAFSRNAEADPFEKVDVRPLIEETLALCQERFKFNNIALKVGEIAEADFECSSTQISQVLLNLLNNSFDAIQTLPEKWITLDVHQTKEKTLQFVVTDSGKGIAKDVAERIMQPFFTTKEFGKGTGLGLSTSRGIAQQHNGTLLLDASCANTRFVLEVPLRQSQTSVTHDPLKSDVKPPIAI